MQLSKEPDVNLVQNKDFFVICKAKKSIFYLTFATKLKFTYENSYSTTFSDSAYYCTVLIWAKNILGGGSWLKVYAKPNSICSRSRKLVWVCKPY